LKKEKWLKENIKTDTYTSNCEIREDSTLETKFNEKSLLRRLQEYPVISKATLLLLMLFGST